MSLYLMHTKFMNKPAQLLLRSHELLPSSYVCQLLQLSVLESSRTSPRPRGSSSTILKSLVLALRVESLASWLKSLEKLDDTLFANHCMFGTNDFEGNNLEFCPLLITE